MYNLLAINNVLYVTHVFHFECSCIPRHARTCQYMFIKLTFDLAHSRARYVAHLRLRHAQVLYINTSLPSLSNSCGVCLYTSQVRIFSNVCDVVNNFRASTSSTVNSMLNCRWILRRNLKTPLHTRRSASVP
jgi:hypothetical protein